jgi:tetratricopeptide (TPR) repeat protein
MLAKKNRIRGGAIVFIAASIFIAGCAPSGPRALLKGKKLLERGDYAGAVEELKTAVSLLPANAQAWNYLGVAEQRAGQPDDAAAAYNRALKLNRDLTEAHFNLGCLWLEQNKPDTARNEFTAFVLRRGNDPAGWLKLGSAQLRLQDFTSAEKSFSTALNFNTNSAEALNGLGLTRVHLGKPREAAQFFAAAARFHPEYAPAILNLATVAHEHLHDDKLALENYRAYLALTPRPADWDAVNAIVNDLDRPTLIASTPAPPPPPPVQIQTAPPAPAPVQVETRTQTTVTVRTTLPPKATTVVHVNPAPPPPRTPPPAPVQPAPVQVVKVQPEPVIATTPAPVAPPAKPPVAVVEPQPQQPQPEPPLTEQTPPPETPRKFNPFGWFSSATPGKKYDQNGVTPLPSSDSTNARVSPVSLPPPKTNPPPPVSNPTVAPLPPVHIIPSAPPPFPRYLYLSPRQPRAGDRNAAARAFAAAQQSEQKGQFDQAMNSYQQAAQLDPGWFEAQYNYGVLAYRQRELARSLAAYEMALAIRPDSADARYNFALALKAAGYMPDAVNELEKIVASNPGETRAHLALANLYARQLEDPARAREHYLKVLQLDPRNPQATDIRFWLSANPQ